MALLKRAMGVLMVMACLQVSMGAVYKVGDTAGWTTIGNVDYKKWAASKTFHVGDTILFEYNVQFHNVMQVTHADYQSCNASSPINSYTSGKDSITIKKTGHYYYLCGIPGHCQAGQKVDIRVVKVSSSMAPSPAPSISPSMSPSASPPGGKAPEPANSKNSASLPSKGFLGMVALALSIFVGFAY